MRAARRGRRSAQAPRRPSLSPSRAADFKTCPLLYRFRTIDRLPERKSLAAVRGTLVHSVLERLYDLPPARAHRRRPPRSCSSRRGPSCARSRASPSCSRPRRTTARRPTSTRRSRSQAWLASAGKLVETYFTLEDPTRIQPHGREELVEVTLPDGLLLRGFVDRLDVAPERGAAGRRLQDRGGAARGVRGQGAVPDEVLRAGALAHPRRGRRPAEAALPQGRRRADLRPGRGGAASASSAPCTAIWAAIERAVTTGDFRPEQDAALRLVRPPGALPGLRRHSPAVPHRGGRGRRLADHAPLRSIVDAARRWPRRPVARRVARTALDPAGGAVRGLPGGDRLRRRAARCRAARSSCRRQRHRRRRTASSPAPDGCPVDRSAADAAARPHRHPRPPLRRQQRRGHWTSSPSSPPTAGGESSRPRRSSTQLAPGSRRCATSATTGGPSSSGARPGRPGRRSSRPDRRSPSPRRALLVDGRRGDRRGRRCAGAVRERAERGADVVKIMASGGVLTPGTDMLALPVHARRAARASWTRPTGHGLPVTAHAHGCAAVELGVAADVDGIEHCSCLTDDGPAAPPGLADRPRRRRHARLPHPRPRCRAVARHPTSQARLAAIGATGRGPPRPRRASCRQAGRHSWRGTDAGIGPSKPHGVLVPMAVVDLVACGASGRRPLRAGDGGAARACGLDRRTGRLAVGLDADLLLVDGDPLIRRRRRSSGPALVVSRGREVARTQAPLGGASARSRRARTSASSATSTPASRPAG